MMDWDDLKFALAVFRHNGLSGAARQLQVNHATVSRRIAGLEDRLGVRLFDRLPGGLIATETGLTLVRHAESVEQEIHALELSIAGKDRSLAGPLRISAPQLIIKYVLSDFLADFARNYPAIDLTVIATSDAVNLHQREADISIRATNEPEESLWGRRVVRQQRSWYCHKDYLVDRQQDDPIDCIHFDWYGQTALADVTRTRPNALVLACYDDMVAVHGAVSDGHGIGRLPCFIGNSSPDLVIVPDLPVEPYLDIWVLTHPDLRQVPRIQRFMEAAAKTLDQHKALFLAP